MKSMTCAQLGGACNKVFTAETFEEIARLSQEHGKEMFLAQDLPHLEAMQKMKVLMQSQEAMQKWMKEKKDHFESLENN